MVTKPQLTDPVDWRIHKQKNQPNSRLLDREGKWSTMLVAWFPHECFSLVQADMPSSHIQSGLNTSLCWGLSNLGSTLVRTDIRSSHQPLPSPPLSCYYYPLLYKTVVSLWDGVVSYAFRRCSHHSMQFWSKNLRDHPSQDSSLLPPETIWRLLSLWQQNSISG